MIFDLIFLQFAKVVRKPWSLAIFMWVAIGCTEEPPPTLNYKEREMVDSLYRIAIDSLKPVFDSICASRRDSAVRFKTDSIIEAQNVEIQKYLQRISNIADQ